ncbi:LacI family DNA-binding transcriptional regulator [Edaphobacter albus]|uniref:LacI family DNA-binding transcriptional regulator n=1 Tax=Edaphobacter sp. 4G125 TaxID=2763071 RepID=UPI001644D057|nr:LacI family DNA-binding transcriptional regulator [Edaphobacter sp. 4G125]QNI36049.1 LacI family DNA-binding transcriptional regulator [Edaphobacter sp. 4G125]
MDMRDIAKLAGVSSATVSRVINGSNLVRPETVERVRKVIEEVKFFPNTSATTLKYGRSGTYGLIIPDITNPFFPEFLKCFESIVVENDHEMLMATTDLHSGHMQQTIRRMLVRRVDGVALLASEIETEPFESLVHNRVPLVTMDRGHIANGLSDVAINNKSGMDQAMLHLKELGHKKIGYIGGSAGLTISEHRVEAFVRALKRVDLVPHPEFMRHGNYRVTGGMAAMTELLSLKDRPTAVLTANDVTAVGAMRVILKMGLTIPRDISIIGFDDIELSDIVHPPLTTLRLNRYDLAKTFYDALQHFKADSRTYGKRHVVKTNLVIRESTGPARKRTATGSSAI